MFKIDQVEFEGYECVKLENDDLALYVTVSVGPRILGCSYRGGPNLFAKLGKLVAIDFVGGGTNYLLGGHRLWYGPERVTTTYVPDNDPVPWQENPNGITLMQKVEAPTGIQKTIQIVLDPDMAAVSVRHTLTNTGAEAFELAPWAITQFQTGGVAILPQNTALADEGGFWANRSLVLWPYAQMHDPNITWGDRFIFLKAGYQDGRFKLGWPNLNGWLAYVLGDTMFVKSALYDPEAFYYDYQSSSQCYCNQYFLELETLGPRTVLEPGESTGHNENWQVFGGVDFAPDEDRMAELADQLGLSAGF